MGFMYSTIVALRQALFLSVIVLLSGCGDSFTVEGVVGDYQLTRINGAGLPLTDDGSLGIDVDSPASPGDEPVVQVLSGTLTLRTNLSWESSLSLNITAGDVTAEQVATESGAYNLLESDVISFADSEDGQTFTGLWDGDRITLTREGNTFEFER